jgi:hypothetical protein
MAVGTGSLVPWWPAKNQIVFVNTYFRERVFVAGFGSWFIPVNMYMCIKSVIALLSGKLLVAFTFRNKKENSQLQATTPTT